jgi:hypothetical protein
METSGTRATWTPRLYSTAAPVFIELKAVYKKASTGPTVRASTGEQVCSRHFRDC